LHSQKIKNQLCDVAQSKNKKIIRVKKSKLICATLHSQKIKKSTESKSKKSKINCVMLHSQKIKKLS
jgi:hypothetical protein